MRLKKTIFLGILTLGILCTQPAVSFAQSRQLQDTDQLALAQVLSATPHGAALIAGTNVHSETQTLTVLVLNGPDKGRTPTFENDYTQLAVGDKFYVRHITSINDGTDLWSVSDPYRLPVIYIVAGVFLVLLLLIGGIQGLRGLISLMGSIALILYVLLPNIYAGHSPILISIGVSGLIILLGSYVTHGFTKTTTSAMLGMLATVLIVGLSTYVVIHFAHLSGFTDETNVYLNFNTDGRISMIGLLFGGIMIGLLGVLYDIAIGQAVAVEELYLAGTHYSQVQVFRRAMRIGREHIGALVNTLAIAYVGSALPLLLLFKETNAGIDFVLNSEIFATELIRILMGSIGLVLAVPITTFIALYLLRGITTSSGAHSHSHSHEHTH